MRGQITLFNDIFIEASTASTGSATEVKKGRSAVLHAKRNECLIDRFFYKGKFFDKRYNKIIEELSHEFFISPVTIPEVISENYTQLLALKNQNPEKSYFVKKWGHLSW